MRRSTLLMCALLVTATFGCEKVKATTGPIGSKIGGAVSATMNAIKAKIDLVRVRFLHKQPAPVAVKPVPTPPPVPPPPPPPPPPGPAAPQSAGTGPRDVPYSSPDTGTIAPGMTEREVYMLWGKPAASRSLGEYTYLYFQNGCEYTCGTLDVVTLQNGHVTDAIVRWPGHGYAGASTSPETATPQAPPGGDVLRVNPDSAAAQPPPNTP
jgi:hypothetical protein